MLVARARWASADVRRDDTVGQTFPVTETPQDRRALEAGEVFVESVSDPALPAEVRELMAGFGEQTLLNVPLRWRGEALGMLVLAEIDGERVFTAAELDFMRAFGEQVTLALSTARSATTDGLTGLANHRVFYERLEQELARARRYDAPVSLLMIDIDDFKELNDTCGHPAGDEALRRLGRLLAEQLRRGVDLPARYGGEEFAVILPSTAVESAPPGEGGSGAPTGGGASGAGAPRGGGGARRAAAQRDRGEPVPSGRGGGAGERPGEHRRRLVPGHGREHGRPGRARRRRALRGQARGQGQGRGVLAPAAGASAPRRHGLTRHSSSIASLRRRSTSTPTTARTATATTPATAIQIPVEPPAAAPPAAALGVRFR